MNTFSKTNSDVVYVVKFIDNTYYTGNPQKQARTPDIDKARVYNHESFVGSDSMLNMYSNISIDNIYEVVPMEICITVEKNELHEV